MSDTYNLNFFHNVRCSDTYNLNDFHCVRCSVIYNLNTVFVVLIDDVTTIELRPKINIKYYLEAE